MSRPMENYMRLELSGHIGKIELNSAKNGTAICNFSVAYNEKGKSTEWFYCAAYRNLAEYIYNNYGKGSHIRITFAKRETSTWKDQSGQTKRAEKWLVWKIGHNQEDFSGAELDEAPAIGDDNIPF